MRVPVVKDDIILGEAPKGAGDTGPASATADSLTVKPGAKAFGAMRRLAGFFSRRRRSIAAIGLTAAGFGGYLVFLQLSGNFHTVIDGELYRSAQPTAGQLETYVHDHGIKTVINLRGESTGARWYVDEIAAAKRLDINHIDFRMSASRGLSTDQAEALVAILRAAPKPILIHCAAGADRTGLVSVIYSERIAGINEDVAENQLSIRFGHIGIPFLSSTFAMDDSWERLERHFGIEG